MKKGLIGKKLGMTQIFAEDGEAIPVTVIEMEPSVVIQKKTVAKDGYDAIQLGYGRIKQSHVTKPLQGHFKHAGKGAFRFLREVPGNSEEYELGQEVKAEIFNPGEYVDITGTTKGKGYAGVIKRHGFGGGRSSHGSMFHRAPVRSARVRILPGYSRGRVCLVRWVMSERRSRIFWCGRSDRKRMSCWSRVPYREATMDSFLSSNP